MLGNVFVGLSFVCILFALQYILLKVLVFGEASIVQGIQGFCTAPVFFYQCITRHIAAYHPCQDIGDGSSLNCSKLDTQSSQVKSFYLLIITIQSFSYVQSMYSDTCREWAGMEVRASCAQDAYRLDCRTYSLTCNHETVLPPMLPVL